jgi:hypothetical protein
MKTQNALHTAIEILAEILDAKKKQPANHEAFPVETLDNLIVPERLACL